MTKMRAACGGGAVCGFLFDPSAPLRSAHATLPRLPFPGLLRNGPPMARLRRLRPAFFCRRQRQGAIPFIQREAFGEGHTLEGHRRPSPAGRNQDFSARRKNGSPPGGLPFLFVLPRRVRGKTAFSACKRASVPRKRVRCSRLQISSKRLRLWRIRIPRCRWCGGAAPRRGCC